MAIAHNNPASIGDGRKLHTVMLEPPESMECVASSLESMECVARFARPPWPPLRPMEVKTFIAVEPLMAGAPLRRGPTPSDRC